MINTNYISYRDSAARVVKEDNLFYRYIFQKYKSEYDHLMSSGLYEQLVRSELLIPHEEIPIAIDNYNNDIYKLLLPKQITFQSYPFEWSFRQWKKALMAYLTINEIALQYGMILKDATPYNFYINSDRAVMFDTSSFMFFNENDTWLAYRQFCEMFLSPIALMYYNGAVWGKLYLSQLQGLPLKFVSKQLSKKSFLNLTVLLHIHIHAKYSSSHIKKAKESESIGFSIEKIKSVISLIKNSVSLWERSNLSQSPWIEYYDVDIETDAYINSKEDVIRNWLKSTKPLSVLDLGANTGKFSFIASYYSDKVIALESDVNCVDQIDKYISTEGNRIIFPLIGDLSAPTPGLGVLNKELSPLFERVTSEMVLCLALVHHLYFVNDMSFALIAELLSKLSYHYLIVEFIPIDDRKVKELMATKPEKSVGYDLESFKINILDHFNHLETVNIECSTRSLMIFKKLNNDEN